MLNLDFEEIKGTQVYHDEVRLFSAKDKETNEIIGHFYVDLHPRDGKYGHAAVFGVQVIQTFIFKQKFNNFKTFIFTGRLFKRQTEASCRYGL